MTRHLPVLTPGEISQLPEREKMFISYWLQKNVSHFDLIVTDTELIGLVKSGWVSQATGGAAGLKHYKFDAMKWQQLQHIREQFLGGINGTDLSRYTAQKTGAYPWCW